MSGITFASHSCLKPQSSSLEWIQKTQGTSDFFAQPLPEHADKRRYFRITLPSRPSLILVEQDNLGAAQKTLRTTKAHLSAGLPVPTIYAHLLTPTLQTLLIEDFGSHTLYDKTRAQHDCSRLYQSSLKLLLQYQASTLNKHLELTRYTHTEALLQMQRGLTALLGAASLPTNLNQEQQHCLDLIHTHWQSVAFSQTHVDFHSANLMLTSHLPQQPLGILDFQDCCLAPYHYDLISISTDHYTDLSNCTRTRMHRFFFEHSHCTANQSFEAFEHSIALISTQRHLKNIGVFLNLVACGKKHYAKPIPHMLARLAAFTNVAPCLKPISKLATLCNERLFLNTSVTPA